MVSSGKVGVVSSEKMGRWVWFQVGEWQVDLVQVEGGCGQNEDGRWVWLQVEGRYGLFFLFLDSQITQRQYPLHLSLGVVGGQRASPWVPPPSTTQWSVDVRTPGIWKRYS